MRVSLGRALRGGGRGMRAAGAVRELTTASGPDTISRAKKLLL
jgi:hypothetical protein